MERLELTHGGRERDVLELGERVHPGEPSVAQYPRWRRVVVERPRERVDDLVVEGRLRVLRQAAHVDPHRLGRPYAPDPFGRHHVDEAGRHPATRDPGHPPPPPPPP